MATPEGKVKGWLRSMLKEEGVWRFAPQAGPYGRSGIPDEVCIVCGLFLGIEVKKDKQSKMTALQERCRKDIEAAGGKHFLVYDKETIEEVRRFIHAARAGGSRQKEADSSLGQSRNYIVIDPNCKACTEQLSDPTAWAGRMCFVSKSGHSCSPTNPVPLQLAGQPEADGSPEGDSSVPDETQEVYCVEWDGDGEDASRVMGSRFSNEGWPDKESVSDLSAVNAGEHMG